MGPNQPHVSMGTGGSSPEVKQAGPKADHSPPSSTVVINKWSYNSTLPICLYDVYRDIIYLICVCVFKRLWCSQYFTEGRPDAETIPRNTVLFFTLQRTSQT
jgi:hypothetical protein